jgi:hypothetical protein
VAISFGALPPICLCPQFAGLCLKTVFEWCAMNNQQHIVEL